MKKDLYKQETLNHKNDPIVQKYTKRILINKILWTALSVVAAGLILLFALLGKSKEWDNKPYIASIVVSSLLTCLVIAMTVMIYLGNVIAVKMHDKHMITFYSGPGNNLLFIDGKLVGKGSSAEKLSYKFENGEMVQIYLATIDFAIEVGKDLPQTLKAKPEVKKPEQPKVEEPKKEQPQA